MAEEASEKLAMLLKCSKAVKARERVKPYILAACGELHRHRK
jgi:hypothetical protein